MPELSVLLAAGAESISWEGLGVLFSILVSVTGALVSYRAGQEMDGERIAKIEVKVETLWDFLFRRSVSEAVVRGLAEVNSPLNVPASVRCLFDPLKDDLRVVYSEMSVPGVTVRDLLARIDAKLGNRILSEVAIPNGMTHDACLLIAVAIASGDGPFELPSDLSTELITELRNTGSTVDGAQK
jgi:hypothetical protein